MQWRRREIFFVGVNFKKLFINSEMFSIALTALSVSFLTISPGFLVDLVARLGGIFV